jgi:hypothetical protein
MAPPRPTEASPFAPPRAGRAAGFWRGWFAVQRRLGIGHLQTPPFVRRATGLLCHPAAPLFTLAVFVVPLLGLRFVRQRWIVKLAPPVFALAALLALGAYGQPLGGVAFGLLVAIHTVGVVAHLDSDAPTATVRGRIFRQLLIASALTIVVSATAGRVCATFVIPVSSPDGPRLINPRDAAAPFRQGATIAFRLGKSYTGGILIREGIYLGRVVAGPGQTIEFTPGAYVVNDLRYPALEHMPAKGRFRTEADQAFVWPLVFQFSGRRGGFPAERALVSDSALVGRPYKRWFWRTWNP